LKKEIFVGRTIYETVCLYKTIEVSADEKKSFCFLHPCSNLLCNGEGFTLVEQCKWIKLLSFSPFSNQKNGKINSFSEREGFEPPVTVKPRWFSKPEHSTTLPPFHKTSKLL